MVEDIQYVVCTHGHSDHCGNLNLFTHAIHVVGYDICRQDQYHLHDFKQVTIDSVLVVLLIVITIFMVIKMIIIVVEVIIISLFSLESGIEVI